MGKVTIISMCDFRKNALDKITPITPTPPTPTEDIIVDNFTRKNGYYWDMLKKQEVSNHNYWYATIDIPQGYTKVTCKFVKSTLGGLGIEFRNSGGTAIGTFSNTTEPNGTELTADIPSGATKLLFSYNTDSYAQQQGGFPKFTNFRFHP